MAVRVGCADAMTGTVDLRTSQVHVTGVAGFVGIGVAPAIASTMARLAAVSSRVAEVWTRGTDRVVEAVSHTVLPAASTATETRRSDAACSTVGGIATMVASPDAVSVG